MKRIVFSVFLFTMLAGFVCAQSDLQVIANVKLQKSEPITLKQLKGRVEAYQKELGRPMTVSEKKEVLDALINERLVVQAAEKEGIKVADSDVNQSFIQMISQQVGRQITEMEFAQLIKQQKGMSLDEFMRSQSGMGLAEYKTLLKSQLLAQRYTMKRKQAELQNIAGPQDSEIRSYYELNQQNFVQPEMLKMSIVLVAKGLTPDSSAAALKKTQEMQQQLVDKPSIASELKIRSQVANSGFQVGEIYINKNAASAQQLGIAMETLLKIFQMKVNGVSEVTETATEFQCFVVQDKYPAKILAIGDIVKPGTTVTVYEYIKNNMMAQSQNKAVSEALNQLINELRTPENYSILKSGAELDKVLTW